MTDLIPELEAWRLSWTPNEIEWRTGWQAAFDDARQERERKKRERKRRDRRTFGPLLWGVPKAKLQRTQTDSAELVAYNLLPFSSEQELASWLGIALTRLRWFTFDRSVETVSHYNRIVIPKRRGGTRLIMAPKPELKVIQRRIYAELLAGLPVHSAAHGFVADRSVISNAALHKGKAFILNLDIKDFFPSIDYRRVRGLFLTLGYNFSVASTLALLCTERERLPMQRNGSPIYTSTGPRVLVQGAPTSPALSNLIARRLDARLSGLARRLNLTYSRYGDDMTFSGESYGAILVALKRAPQIIQAEGFTVHPEKTHLYRQSNRQVVTGLVVNQKIAVPRQVRRTLRATLHNAQTTGLAAQNTNGIPNFRSYLSGLIGYIHATDSALADRLRAQLNAAKD